MTEDEKAERARMSTGTANLQAALDLLEVYLESQGAPCAGSLILSAARKELATFRAPPCAAKKEAAAITKVIRGLLAIAEQAMPSTFFQTDRRVKAAQQLLEKLKRRP